MIFETVSYNNDEEYRQQIKRIFEINDSDDEYFLDTATMNRGFDFIYDMTHKHPVFNRFYINAAAKMMSVDPNIGLCVLFSYDYFSLFYFCFLIYHDNPDNFHEDLECVKMLKESLEKK